MRHLWICGITHSYVQNDTFIYILGVSIWLFLNNNKKRTTPELHQNGMSDPHYKFKSNHLEQLNFCRGIVYRYTIVLTNLLSYLRTRSLECASTTGSCESACYVRVYICECVCERERERGVYIYICVCVCVREREREREAYICIYMCERERERERERLCACAYMYAYNTCSTCPIYRIYRNWCDSTCHVDICVYIYVCVCVCVCVCVRERVVVCVCIYVRI